MPEKRADVQVTIYLDPDVHDKVLEQMEAFNQTKAGAIELLLMQALGMQPEVHERLKGIRRLLR